MESTQTINRHTHLHQNLSYLWSHMMKEAQLHLLTLELDESDGNGVLSNCPTNAASKRLANTLERGSMNMLNHKTGNPIPSIPFGARVNNNTSPVIAGLTVPPHDFLCVVSEVDPAAVQILCHVCISEKATLIRYLSNLKPAKCTFDIKLRLHIFTFFSDPGEDELDM